MFACVHAPGGESSTLLALARQFSPLVELTWHDTVVCDIGGLGRLFGGPREIASAICRQGAELGLHANLAIAANPDTAVLAARNLPGVTLIAPGREAETLGLLPIQAIPVQTDTLETLKRWGIRTLADVTELPPLGLAARLGEEGHYLRLLALGQISRPLYATAVPRDFSAHTELEDPVALLEPLLFVVSALIHEVLHRLAGFSLATDQIALTLGLADGAWHTRTLEFPVPVRDARIVLKQIQLDLEAHPPAAPIRAVAVTLRPASPRTVQNGLFVPASPEPEKLHVLIAKLIALTRHEVGAPEVLDTHRPDTHQIRPLSAALKLPEISKRIQLLKLAFRFFRPALDATVTLAAERPAHVAAPGIRGRVLAAAGPWRASGEWWTSTAWARDEWDVGLQGGAVYRIYRQHDSGSWFVEGSYD